MVKSILSIFLAVTLSLVVSIAIFPAYSVTAATTIYVDATNTSDPAEDGSPAHPYDMIQEGIDAASLPGDTVYVLSGTYSENLIITKPLTLEGEDSETTIIKGTGSFFGIYIQNTSGVTIRNLTVRNFNKGIWVENCSEIGLVGNIITANYFGIALFSSNNNIISNNTIFNNRQGIHLSNSSENTITGNTIYGNVWAIFLVLSSNNEVYNNNFTDDLNVVYFLSSSGNVFNSDKPVGGNYWGNWTTPDLDGDGFVDKPYKFAGVEDNLPWTQQDGWKNSPATVDIKPDTLNLNTKGKWITCYIELEESYDVADIDVSTIKLNETVPAEENPAVISDYDEDNIPDLMVKFDRTSVQEMLEVGDEVEIVITGELTDGTSFEGTDTIRVIDKSND